MSESLTSLQFGLWAVVCGLLPNSEKYKGSKPHGKLLNQEEETVCGHLKMVQASHR